MTSAIFLGIQLLIPSYPRPSGCRIARIPLACVTVHELPAAVIVVKWQARNQAQQVQPCTLPYACTRPYETGAGL